MKKARRILLIGGVLVLSVTVAEAGIWGSRNAQKPAETVAAASTTSLEAVEVDGARILLRTSGAPAYTSYSPAPGVFVVDLTETSRAAGVTIPQTLPPSITSVSAEQVVEMGSPLTRVTFRLTHPGTPEVTAAEKAVMVTVPVVAVADSAVATETAPAVEPLPAVTPVASAVAENTGVEPVSGSVVEVAEPVVTTEEVPLPRARTVKAIEAHQADGGVEVRIAGDGQLDYKAFRLENPSRLVIDLNGVRNAAVKNTVSVTDDVVKRVRVAQFQPTVARVVIDLTHKAEYDITPSGGTLVVAFSPAAIASHETAPQVKTAAIETQPVIAETPVVAKAATISAPATTPADIPAQVPAVATAASTTWNVPAAPRAEPVSSGARSRITSASEQAPPTTTSREDVFNDAAAATPAPTPTTAAQSLSSTRTLSGGPRVFTGEPISLNLKDADIKDVLRTFAELTGLNIAVDPGVSGAVTVDFVDVPWDQALDLILRQNGLSFTLEGNVMRVGTLDRIAAEAAATRRLDEEQRLNVQLTTLSFKLSYARAPEVAALLKDIASPRARIITDTRTNQVIISEIPEYLRTMQNLITTIDIPSRQVMIEARIVESLRQFTQAWGFDWGFDGALDPATGTGTGLVFPNRVGYTGGPFQFGGSAGNIISMTLMDVLGTFNLDLALHAAETQGYAKVVSAPRVTTQDNQAAEIQSGFQIPYQTRVNFTTTVTYLDATLRLSVTPQITEAGTVIMDIAVQKNEPATGLAIEGAAGTPLTTRQARTRLMVRDGGTAVIAGIFQTRDNNSEKRVPIVHNIPVIGGLFKSHNVDTQHDELLIFITPRIVRG